MEPHPRILTPLKWMGAVSSGVWPMLIPLGLMVPLGAWSLAVVGPRATAGILLGSFVYLILALIGFLAFLLHRTARAWVMAGGPALAFACVQAIILISHMNALADAARTPRPLPDSISPDALTGALLAISAVCAFAVIACWEALVGCVLLARYWRRPGPGKCPTCGYDRAGLPGGARAVCPECGTNPASV